MVDLGERVEAEKADTASSATEVVELPATWRARRLGELGQQFFGGGTPSSNVPEYWGGGVPWTTSAAISGLKLTKGIREISPLGLSRSAARVVPAGNLLIGTRVGVGKAAINDVDMAISQDLTGMVVQRDKVDVLFLAYALQSPAVQERFRVGARGSTIKGISRDDLIQIPIPVPPLAEQRAIAHVLSTVQRAREATEVVIAATRELKHSLMRHLFTYGPVAPDQTDHVRLMETEVGLLPADWTITTLGKVAHVGNGSTPKRDNPAYWQDGSTPWINSSSVHLTRIQTPSQFVTDVALRECHLPVVPRGSVVIAITGQGKTLGTSSMVLFDTTVNQHLAYLRFVGPEVLPEFVLAYLQTRYDDLRALGNAGGSTKAALTCGLLRRYPLPLPPLSDQKHLVEVLDKADAKLGSEERRKLALDEVFASLLGNLMSGRVRADGAIAA